MQPEFGWAIDLPTFQKLFPKIPPDTVQRAFALWDPQSRGRVDALQMIAGAILTAQGMYLEKIGGLFKLFDMDDSKSLSKDEMLITIKACVWAVCRMTVSLSLSLPLSLSL